MASLKAERKNALADGDVDRFTAVEEQMEKLREQRQEEKQDVKQVQQQGPSPAFQAFIAENSWYVRDPELAAVADNLGIAYYQRGHTEEQTLQYVANQVRKIYPEKFGNPQTKPKASAVESGTSGTQVNTKKKGMSWEDLDPEQRRVAEKWVKMGVITKEKYLEDFKLVNRD